MKKLFLFIPVLIVMLLAGCEEANQYPRPYGFPRIDLPAHTYAQFEHPNCPFTFEYPEFGKIQEYRPDSCWVDISFEQFDAKWHITYRHIPTSNKTLSQHYEEYRKLIYKHSPKVSNIEEYALTTPNGTGTMYELYGAVGTPAQIFFTDSTHIMMMSSYFNTATKNDSLAPVIDFLKYDLDHVVQTMAFK